MLGEGERLSLGVAARLSRYLQVLTQARKIMRTSGQHNIALFGAGNLGRAIANSDIFADHGFRIVAMFDVDEGVVGSEVGARFAARFQPARLLWSNVIARSAPGRGVAGWAPSGPLRWA